MSISMENKEYILKSIEGLPPQKVQEVLDFIDFLRMRFRPNQSGVDESALLLQQNALLKIWENEEDLYEL